MPDSPDQLPRVLIVDDDPIMVDLVADIFRQSGVQDIFSATDGAEGLALIKSQESGLDLIVCDLNMPGMDGVSFMGELHLLGFTGAFAVFSGESSAILRTASQLARAHSLAFIGAVSKPFTRADSRVLLDRYRRLARKAAPPTRTVMSDEDLREAIGGSQLCAFYQPQIATQDRRVVGAEALVRWNHPVHGMIPPDDFIPLAEEHGRIEDLTEIMFGQVLADYSKMAALCGEDFTVSVNLSVLSLQSPTLPEHFSGAAIEAGVDPSKIVLEVTESRLIDDILLYLEVLTRLRLRGFQLSIDDFGTGYSSMKQLRMVPFTELKIDRSFVKLALVDDSALAVLEASVDLARKLRLRTVAEGVENRDEWDLVSSYGCDFVQGFYISKPLPIDAVLAFMRDWHGELPPTGGGGGPHAMSDRSILDTSELTVAVGAASAGMYVARVLAQLTRSLPELDGLCRAGDLEELAGRCHKLKSSARAVGAIAVADALAEVERVARTGQQGLAQSIVETLPGLVEELRARARELP